MKTLVNKANPAIRITAPEITIAHPPISNEGYVYWIPAISEMYNPIDWTLVEEEPACKESLQAEEEHPDNFTSFEWLIGRLMFRGCDLWGMTDGEDDNGVVTKLIKDRAAEMMELLERELDPNAEPVDFEKLALEKYPIQMVAKDPFDDEDDTKEDLNEYEREAYLEGLKKGYELEKGGSK